MSVQYSWTTDVPSNIARVCYASRRLKRRKSERDGAMFRKSWSWNVKEARGLRRRRMTMPWEKLD